MADLVIRPSLADHIRALADRERRPVDALLADMLARYRASLSDDDLDALLSASGITLPVPGDDAPPPISPLLPVGVAVWVMAVCLTFVWCVALGS